MAEYNQPWQALLNTNIQPVNNVANPDVDKAMGYDVQSGDDDATQFNKALQSSLFRNSPEGREVGAEAAKQKIAAQVQLQLAQQKLQLAQQYPEYKQFQTPYGAIVSINPYNPSDTKTFEPIAGAKDAYTAKMAAETADDNMKASPEYIQAQMAETQAKPGLVQAQTDYYKARPALEAAQANAATARAAAVGIPKPKYATLQDAQKDAAMEITGYYPNDKNYARAIRGDESGQLSQRINARAQQLYTQQGNPAVTKGGSASTPDASGLFNFGGSTSGVSANQDDL